MKKFYGFLFSIALVGFFAISSFHSGYSTASTNSLDYSSSSRLIAQTSSEEFTLPPLPYAYDALEAYIDSQTMTLHHDKHHAGYVKNLNGAIALHPDLQGVSIEELLRDLDSIPEDILTTVRNSGGGHANHSMFWSIMTPNSPGQPTGEIAEAINTTFGDFATFQEEFNTAGKKRFGSGWAWLVMNEDGTLEVTSTANQDSPFSNGQYPIMGAAELERRLIKIFLPKDNGELPIYGDFMKFQTDENWHNLLLFNEYFHGDNGAGLGASHQTGWTGLVAKLIMQRSKYS